MTPLQKILNLDLADTKDQRAHVLGQEAAIKELFLELVGKDSLLDKPYGSDPGFDWENFWKNELRDELRVNIKEL